MIDLLTFTCLSILIGLSFELYYKNIKTLVISHDKIQIDFKLLNKKVDKIEKLINEQDTNNQDKNQDTNQDTNQDYTNNQQEQ